MSQIDAFTAARILGCRPDEARQLLGGARVDLAAVETLAMTVYSHDEHGDDLDSYWCTTAQAAREVFGLPADRVAQLLDEDLVPFELHASEQRLMRRAQIETVANARLCERGRLRVVGEVNALLDVAWLSRPG